MSTPQHAKSSLVNEYAKRISQSFAELGHTVDGQTIEQLAIFLVRTMGSESRDYHRPEHSLDVSRVDYPIARIAALFHDLIYLQVDPSWRLVKEFMEPFVPDENLTVNVVNALQRTDDPWMHAIAALFNVQHDKSLTTSSGVNEFLSAVVMYKKLIPFFTPTQMLQALACVEATIFFDKLCALERTQEERVRANLNRATKKLSLPDVTDAVFKETFIECRRLIERDLASFAANDVADFVSNTWNVMIENNQTLRNSYYLISNYRRAVYGVIGFLKGLDPEKMFWTRDTPQIAPATYNLRVGIVYLKAFALGVTVTEAVAVLTGGDAPYDLFVGPMKRSREHQTYTLNDILVLPSSVEGDSEARQVYQILCAGRTLRSRFDQKNNPLGAFLFARLGRDGAMSAFEAATVFHSKKARGGADSAREFLGHIPTDVLNVVLDAFCETAISRRGLIVGLKRAI